MHMNKCVKSDPSLSFPYRYPRDPSRVLSEEITEISEISKHVPIRRKIREYSHWHLATSQKERLH
jgi:hypothetical protein